MNVAVYLSSREDISPSFSNAVREIGEALGEMGARLVYGGSNAGQMHLLAETAKRAGAVVTGVIPEVFRHLADPVADEIIYTLDLSERKARMMELGEVFVALPGGVGTLDEVMSTLAYMAVNRDYRRKVVLVNVDGLYDPLIAQLREFQRLNLAAPEVAGCVEVVPTAADCIELIKLLNQKQPAKT